MKKLINQVVGIIDEYEEEKRKQGLDNNIFTLMEIERRELKTHEYMILAILRHRTELVKQFMECMELPKSFQNESWNIEKEHHIVTKGKLGRIDLFFTSKPKMRTKKKKCVVVELKIDAGDQNNQLKRYKDYVIEKGYAENGNEYKIIYLTLDGKEPSEQSCRGSKKNILLRSFEEHILLWLESCIEICQEYGDDVSFIQQYQILVKKLTSGEQMEDKVTELIKGSEELRKCIEIKQALPDIKGQLLYDFMDTIHQELAKQECEFLYGEFDYECAKEYYGKNVKIPDIICKITEFTSKNKKIKLALGIEVYYNLYFYIGYFNEQNELINNEQFKKNNKRKNEKVENAITQVLNAEIRNNNTDLIIWKTILNSNNQVYDFKHFSESCANLMDKSTLKKEAQRIARDASYYIKEIQDILEDDE